MTAQLDIFSTPKEVCPSVIDVSSPRYAAERINPMVRVWGVGPEGVRCKTCIHFIVKRFSGNRYFKCSFRGNTNGPGTDHRANWPACGKYLSNGKEVGIRQSYDHANAVEKDWGKQAAALLREFVATQTGDFMAEDVREYAYSKGLTRPPSERAFGGVILRAASEGVIRKSGYGMVKNKKAHAAFARVWRGSGRTNI